MVSEVISNVNIDGFSIQSEIDLHPSIVNIDWSTFGGWQKPNRYPVTITFQNVVLASEFLLSGDVLFDINPIVAATSFVSGEFTLSPFSIDSGLDLHATTKNISWAFSPVLEPTLVREISWSAVIDPVYANSNLTLTDFTIDSVVFVEQIPTVTSSITYDFTIASVVDHGAVYYVNSTYSFDEINSVGTLEAIQAINGSATLPNIAVAGSILKVESEISGVIPFISEFYSDISVPPPELSSNITLDGVGVVGSAFLLDNFNNRIKIPDFIIQSDILLIPVIASTLTIPSLTTNGNTYISPLIADSNVLFDGIILTKNRMEFGFPKPPIIRQIYESSLMRTLDVTPIPEEASYAVFIGTTDYNMVDEEIKSGLIELEFEFEDDAINVEDIILWVRDVNGDMTKDKFNTITTPGHLHADHILHHPLKTGGTKIAIQCILKKGYDAVIEVVYRDPVVGTYGRISMSSGAKKSYFIDVQHKLTNRTPYLNIGDAEMVKGPSVGSGTITNVTDSNFPITIVQEDISPDDNPSASTTPYKEVVFDLLTRKFVTVEDTQELSYPAAGFPVSIVEFVDLSSGQIGG